MASQRVKAQVAAGKAAKAQHGGARPGAGKPKGVRLTQASREKIRGAMLVRRLEQIAMSEVISEPHQVTAALGLLRFQLPTLAATDITSGGEPITVERVTFGKADKSSM